jgi:uncharacterized hydrophobic protein (TIGR00271 family)
VSPHETEGTAGADSAGADSAGADSAGADSADAAMRDQLIARIGEDSALNPALLAFLTLACLIGALGVVLDSPVTVVGAMVIGPEFGPLAALAVSLVFGPLSRARQALTAVLVGFPVAMAITAVMVLAGEAVGWIELHSARQLTDVDFIYQVGPLSFVIALLAGAAGMLALVSNRSATLVGVFISVTTVPAAGFAVIAATRGWWTVARLSAAQLAVNLVGIVVAGIVVLMIWRRREVRRRRASAHSREG